MKKFLILIVVLLVVAAAAAGGFYYYTQNQAQKAVDDYLNSIPGVKSVSHGGISYSLLGQKLVIPDLKLGWEEPQAMNMEVASIELDKPNLSVFEKMKTAPEGAPMESLADSINITGLKAADKQVEVTVDQYTVKNPQLGSIAFIKEGQEMTPMEAAKLGKATAVELAEITNMKIVDKAAGKQVGLIKTARVENYKAGKIGKVVMEGFEILPEEGGKVTIALASATNLDYSNAIETFAKMAETGQPGADISNMGITYDQIKVEGIDVTAKDNKNVKIATVTMDNFKQVNGIPASLNFNMSGITMAVAQLDDPKAKETIKALGYELIVADLGFDYNWDAEAKRLDLKKLSLGGPDIGTLSLSLSLDGVDLAAIKNINDLMGLMGTLMFTQAELSYTDASLAGRILKAAATMQGTDPDTMRTGLIQQVMGMQQMMDPTPEGKKMAEALVAFVKDPKSLLLSAKPEKPLPAMMLAGQAKTQPVELAKSLNLMLSVNGGDAVAVHIPDMAMGMAPSSPSAPAPGSMAPAPMAPAPTTPAPMTPAPAPTPGEEQAKPAGPGGFSFGDMFKKSMPAPAQPDSSGEVKAQPLN